MKLLLVGASGLVDSHVLQRALADERISEVVAPSLRPLIDHPYYHQLELNLRLF